VTSYFVNPDPYYTPKISIGPFNLKTESQRAIEIDPNILKTLGTNLLFTSSGKQAIEIALETLKIHEQNTVGIITTSGNMYVSKCVTETVSKFCNWVMYDRNQNVDCLIVIHEFGVLLDIDSMNDLRSLDIPIINDFAYSFLSLYISKRLDFLNEINITSFPKCFNINFGGLIHLPNLKISADDRQIENKILDKLKDQLNSSAIEENISARKRNREFYKINLPKHGFEVIWNHEEICPGVCMISPTKSTDLQELKNFLQRNGIECSVFYGKEAFFIPVHSFLSRQELEYILFMIGAFENVD